MYTTTSSTKHTINKFYVYWSETRFGGDNATVASTCVFAIGDSGPAEAINVSEVYVL